MRIIATVINDLSYDQRMIRICTTLAEAGHEVTLVGRNKKASVPLVERPFQQKRLRCFFYKGKLFYLEYNIRLLVFLLSARFDVVNSVDLDTILPGYYASKIRNKHVVYDAHEYFTEQPEIVTRPLVKKTWKWVERHCIPGIRHAYTVCESLAELFKEEYGIAFGVVRNVPFLRKGDDGGMDKSERIILYQGALNDGRGLEEVIDAMEHINGATLWLAGEGDLSAALRQRVADRALEDKVVFLGYLQPECLAELTPKAYIGLNLLQNKGLNYYYSLANKSFDYIQALVPSINMDFPEYRKIRQEYEVASLIPDLAPGTIRQAISRLLEDEDLYDHMKAECVRAKEVYVWEREKGRLLEVYAGLGH